MEDGANVKETGSEVKYAHTCWGKELLFCPGYWCFVYNCPCQWNTTLQLFPKLSILFPMIATYTSTINCTTFYKLKSFKLSPPAAGLAYTSDQCIRFHCTPVVKPSHSILQWERKKNSAHTGPCNNEHWTWDPILIQTTGFSAFPVPSLTLETEAYKQGQVATGNNLGAVSTWQKKMFHFNYAVLLKSAWCCWDSSAVKNTQQ